MCMKRTILPASLFMFLLLCTSFKRQTVDERFSNSGYFMAIVGTGIFELRDDRKFMGEMRTKSSTMNNKSSELNRSATSITFYGNSFTDASGKTFDETINFEYALNNGSTGAVNDLKVELNYDQQNYYHIPERTKFNVTKLDWSADHKTCLVTAEFDCRMRRWGFPVEEQPVIRLKGRMVGINVTVPPWIASKLNVEASLGQ